MAMRPLKVSKTQLSTPCPSVSRAERILWKKSTFLQASSVLFCLILHIGLSSSSFQSYLTMTAAWTKSTSAAFHAKNELQATTIRMRWHNYARNRHYLLPANQNLRHRLRRFQLTSRTALASSVKDHHVNATFPSAMISNTAINPVERELTVLLRELAHFNGGRIVNPRSPRQVSNLLYGTNADGRIPMGPTDKATLGKIIHGQCPQNESDEEEFKRKQVAQLVLQCRELIAKQGRSIRPQIGPQAGPQVRPRVASFSTVASDTSSIRGRNGSENENKKINDREGQSVRKINNHDQRGDSSTENNDGSIITEPLFSIRSLSPYHQMVRKLFPDCDTIDNNGGCGNNDNPVKEEDASSLDPYWIEPLLSLTKPSARSLIRQLQPTSCPMGYDPSATPLTSLKSNLTTTQKGGSLLSFVREQKSAHFRDAVLLVRVGDFYESYGIDAILLVEHCGLNPMAGKARAGCPWRNIQGTLDGLTNAGFRVAVYEEASDDQFLAAKSGNRLKTRYLAQVVSSANPTYMHGLVLKDDASASIDSPTGQDAVSSSYIPGRSYVGVIETHAGYTLVEVSSEERTAVVSERLTAEAVSCRLVAYPPADPLFYVPPVGLKRRGDRLPFLPWREPLSNRWQSGFQSGKKVRVKTLPASLVVSPTPGLTEIERAKQTIVSAFLHLEDDSLMSSTDDSDSYTPSPLKKQERRRVTHKDFVVITSSTGNSFDAGEETHLVSEDINHRARTQSTSSLPLHLETATQLGLMSDPSIPTLVSYLLPDSAPSSLRRFLRRWLLIPPPPETADAMAQLVSVIKGDCNRVLPSLNAPLLSGKVTSLIRAGQASASVYREILFALDAAIETLMLDGNDCECQFGVVDPLLKILFRETGLPVFNAATLRGSFLDTMQIIGNVVSTHSFDHSTGYLNVDKLEDHVSCHGDVVPYAFFERNEAVWRGRVKPNVLEHADNVALAAKKLAEVIAIDFWGVENVQVGDEGEIDLSTAQETKSPIVQDIFNNIIAIKAIPSWANASKTNENESGAYYFHPRDRNGKILRNRYTTGRVQEAISEYIEACEEARKEVMEVLTKLSWKLVDDGHLRSIAQSSHLNLILSTAAHHAASSNARGWNIATIHDDAGLESAGHFENVWPYWMDRSESIPNTFDLDGLFLLTAPNMSGKSTLMRSTAAAALLVNCGLCAPLGEGSSLRRFDSIFVRGASADVPTENKSAFGAEMGDMASLLRTCGDRSLVFVDEIGRGTSPRDGTSLAGAILENMSESGMSGMFATHLHGIIDIPYSASAVERLKKKRMAISEDSSNTFEWTYKLEDGVCNNSLALVTAAKFGLPKSIIKRAKDLSTNYDDKQQISRPLARQKLNVTSKSLQCAIDILEDVSGQKNKSIHIPPSHMSPPSLEGNSCVYILQIGNRSDSSSYYVGETDSLSKRLSQHRAKGNEWLTLSATAVQIKGGKSHARNIESLVIQRMSRRGFDMVSVTDGKSIRSTGKIIGSK